MRTPFPAASLIDRVAIKKDGDPSTKGKAGIFGNKAIAKQEYDHCRGGSCYEQASVLWRSIVGDKFRECIDGPSSTMLKLAPLNRPGEGYLQNAHHRCVPFT